MFPIACTADHNPCAKRAGSSHRSLDSHPTFHSRRNGLAGRLGLWRCDGAPVVYLFGDRIMQPNSCRLILLLVGRLGTRFQDPCFQKRVRPGHEFFYFCFYHQRPLINQPQSISRPQSICNARLEIGKDRIAPTQNFGTRLLDNERGLAAYESSFNAASWNFVAPS